MTLDNKVAACSEGFRNESWSIHNGYPKQNNEENVIMDNICLVGEIESESSSSSDFSSYVESLHEDEMGNEFKVYTNSLYDEDCDDDQPTFFQNVQRGSLHGVINPLFEDDMEVSDLVEDDINCDTQSYCCNKSDCSSSICDRKYSNDATFYELEGEVLDEVFIEICWHLAWSFMKNILI